jgi:hypothetical protein
MRRSELDPRVVDAAFALAGGQGEAVLIGRRSSRARAQVNDVRSLDAGARYASACWWCDDEVEPLTELCSLRATLVPGAAIVAMADDKPAPLERLRALVGGVKKRVTRERLCSALVLAGLLEPSAQVVHGVLLVRALLPARLDALDALFEQPPRA